MSRDVPKADRRLLNLRVALILASMAVFGPLAGLTVVLAADWLVWLLAWPERDCDRGVFRESKTTGRLYELTPGLQFQFYQFSRRLFARVEPVPTSVNERGFRGPWPHRIEPASGDSIFADPLKVLLLGDSMGFGEGVPDGHEFPARLWERWRASPPTDRSLALYNASVGGYNTTQEMATLREMLPELKPDLVWLTVTLEDTLPWGEVRVMPDGRLSRPARPLRHRIRDVLKKSGLLWWLHEAYRRQRLDQYIPRLFAADFPGFREWKQTMRHFAEALGDRRRGAVLLLPGCWKLGDYPWTAQHATIRETCEELGLLCVDLLPAVEGRVDHELWCHPLDLHPNATAHALFAEYLAKHTALRKQVQESADRTSTLEMTKEAAHGIGS